jgi:chromate transporter
MLTDPAEQTAPAPPSFAQAFVYWLSLGFISFGGPAGQIAIMHRDLVERRRWISEARFLHALNYCMLLPGPEAQQLATYIGWLMHRTLGGITAGVLFVLPSLVILIALSWIYIEFGSVSIVAGVFYGIKPAVTAIVLLAAHRIGSRTLKSPLLWAIATGSFIGVFSFHVPFPAIVAIAALIGALGGKLRSTQFRTSGGHHNAQKSYGPALIDDNTPRPHHADFKIGRVAKIVIVGFLLWTLPIAGLAALFGWDGVLPQMGLFFTKAALLTFGGAYAVLPYVYQGAVLQFNWLTPSQMIDGLALGETTPGPLIMVVAFVAFLGAFGKPVFGPDSAASSGVIAAVIVTWFTFLPSFLFILIGGPLVEMTRSKLSFTAPLTAITAAVVGVIISLAWFFAEHTFWPTGIHGAPDWFALALGFGAFIALFYYKMGIPRVLGICAIAGALSAVIN